MHSLRAALIVFQKELREIFRDKRSLFNLVISPLLITPLILALVGTITARQMKESRQETISIGLVGIERAPAFKKILGTPQKIKWKPLTRAEAEAQIKKRDIRAAVTLPDDAQTRLDQGQTVTLGLLMDEGSTASREAVKRLDDAVEERGKVLLQTRLRENALSIELATPLRTREEAVKGGGSTGLLLLSTFLPYMLTIYAILGGVSAANDSVAGEKERGTLETLLLSPVSRRDLVMGKFLSVASVSLLSSLMSVVGLLWPFYTKLNAFAWMTQGTQGGLTLSPGSVAIIILVQLPLAVLGAGLLMIISTYSRNQKEAQTYLGPVLVLVSVAAMLSMILKADVGVVYAAVPILNAALVLKQALEGVFNAPFVAIACLTSLLYAGVALVAAARMFEKESVLLKA